MTQLNSTDQILIQAMLDGDSTAFDILFDRYNRQVKQRILRIVRNDSAAEDILQEVFLRLWTRASQWHGTGTLAGWLLRMAGNLALNHLRSQRRRKCQPLELQTVQEDEADLTTPSWMRDYDSPQPDEALEQLEQHNRLTQLVNRLPPPQRQVIRMVHEAEMDIREVANQLDVPRGTIKSRLYYARRKLSEDWED
ncbi:sigma-70 family RNA polymerase sigma factor [bacterium]|nr:sigma-70 family RNA polymerase sigma factor [bacterium]